MSEILPWAIRGWAGKETLSDWVSVGCVGSQIRSIRVLVLDSAERLRSFLKCCSCDCQRVSCMEI